MRTHSETERFARRAGLSGMLAWLLAAAVAVSACGEAGDVEDVANTTASALACCVARPMAQPEAVGCSQVGTGAPLR
jgi:hypothetical protein